MSPLPAKASTFDVSSVGQRREAGLSVTLRFLVCGFMKVEWFDGSGIV